MSSPESRNRTVVVIADEVGPIGPAAVRPALRTRWVHPEHEGTFVVARADRGAHARVYLEQRDGRGHIVGRARVPIWEWPGPWREAEDAVHSPKAERESSYRVFARNWRNGWLADGCPEHDCAENRVKLDHMLYPVCGVCGAVEGESLTGPHPRARGLAPSSTSPRTQLSPEEET